MWYPLLINDPTFKQMAADRWNMISGVLSEYAGEIIDMQSYLAASWECNNSMWPINHGKYSECGTRDFQTTSGFCGDEELLRFSDIITAFHTAYMARLNGMNDFVSGKKWPVSEWQNKIN